MPCRSFATMPRNYGRRPLKPKGRNSVHATFFHRRAPRLHWVGFKPWRRILTPRLIPESPCSHVAYIDGYGNVKTTIRFDEKIFPPGITRAVQIGSVTHEAIISDGPFGVEAGQLAFAAGQQRMADQVRRTGAGVELFLRGGNAWDMFKGPAIGTEIELKS